MRDVPVFPGFCVSGAVFVRSLSFPQTPTDISAFTEEMLCQTSQCPVAFRPRRRSVSSKVSKAATRRGKLRLRCELVGERSSKVWAVWTCWERGGAGAKPGPNEIGAQGPDLQGVRQTCELARCARSYFGCSPRPNLKTWVRPSPARQVMSVGQATRSVSSMIHRRKIGRATETTELTKLGVTQGVIPDTNWDGVSNCFHVGWTLRLSIIGHPN